MRLISRKTTAFRLRLMYVKSISEWYAVYMSTKRLRGGYKKKQVVTAITAATAAIIATAIVSSPNWLSNNVYTPPSPTKSSNCLAVNGIEDMACTPGAVITSATRTQICTPGYSSSVRNVPESEKNQVYTEYGITAHTTGQYEVDHLISLELGGSNDISNLWPEAADPTPGFHQKDQVENYLHKQVCDRKLPLEQAQHEIATDWLNVYRTMLMH